MNVNGKGIIIAYDNNRVNSNNTKMKPNENHFKSFIYDAVKQLKSGHPVLCFSEEQVKAVNERIAVWARYDSDNRWWVLSKKEM